LYKDTLYCEILFYKKISSLKSQQFHFLFNRAAKDLEERRSHYEPSLHPGVPDDIDHSFKIEENDFVPHFQRVSISGEDTSGVSLRLLISVLLL